jgi:hypothetical protein
VPHAQKFQLSKRIVCEFRFAACGVLRQSRHMLAAPVRRFTVEEYHRLAEAGVLREDERVELLNGVIVPMMPIGPFHGGVTKWLSAILHETSRGRWITSTQDPVQLGEHDEPQPDLMLLRPVADFYRHRHPGAQDVFLLVEVSDSSLLVDRAEKVPAYAAAGIPEVWIVNLPQLLIEVHREPVAGSYSQIAKVRPGEPLAPMAFPDATIDTAALLAPGAT